MNGGISSGQILLVFFFLILLVFALPMYRSRTGTDPFSKIFGNRRVSLFRKGNMPPAETIPLKEPHLSNGTVGELKGFIADLARKSVSRNFGVVSPGYIVWKGKKADLTAIIVREDIITGIQCLGFGGTVTRKPDGSWIQHLNGQDLPIESPEKTAARQKELCDTAFIQNGISKNTEIITVFTCRSVTLIGTDPASCYKKEEYLRHLTSVTERGKSGETVDSETRRIAGLADIKSLKKKRS